MMTAPVGMRDGERGKRLLHLAHCCQLKHNYARESEEEQRNYDNIAVTIYRRALKSHQPGDQRPPFPPSQIPPVISSAPYTSVWRFADLALPHRTATFRPS